MNLEWFIYMYDTTCCSLPSMIIDYHFMINNGHAEKPTSTILSVKDSLPVRRKGVGQSVALTIAVANRRANIEKWPLYLRLKS